MKTAAMLVMLMAVAASAAPLRALLDTSCKGVRDQCLDDQRFCESSHKNKCADGMKCKMNRGEPWCIDECHDSRDKCSSETTYCSHGKTHTCNSVSTCTQDLNGKPMCVANKPKVDDKCKKIGTDFECTSDQAGFCKDGKYTKCKSGKLCFLAADDNDISVPQCIYN